MQEKLLREIASQYLIPMFSGAILEEDALPSTKSHNLVTLTPRGIEFKVNSNDAYRLRLARAQPFSNPNDVFISERRVVEAFIEVLGGMENELEGPLKRDLLTTFERRIVAKSVSDRINEKAILNGIDRLAGWSSSLYEGSPISASFAYSINSATGPSLRLEEIISEEFSAVLSNGYDTLVQFDNQEKLISHESLDLDFKFSQSSPEKTEKYKVYDFKVFCPFRQLPLAKWTLNNNGGTIIALNRLGELLVIKNGNLVFTRRSGRWSFFTHNPVLVQMGTPHDLHIRKSVYDTCLDASFARTGACIGIVSQQYARKLSSIVTDKNDHLDSLISTKAIALSKIINGKKFQELDRRLRLELTAIDGSTVISNEGTILAVGAILKLPGGSTRGARQAAAQQLGTLGLGIKVSQDGSITGYRLNKKNPAFIIM